MGICAITVRTGGVGDTELREAGFPDVVDDAAGVLDILGLDSSPIEDASRVEWS